MGLYFGTDAEGTAWLLYLDPARASGTLYTVVGPAALCGVQVVSDTALSFQTALIIDLRYVFAGSVQTDGVITGAIRQITSGWRNPRDTLALAVTLHPVESRGGPDIEDSSSGISTGLYSNVGYSNEGGDATGAEIVLAGSLAQPVVVVVRFEGSPEGPYGGDSVRITGDTMSFALTSPHRSHLRANIGGDRIVIEPEDTLPRKMTLAELFKGLPKFACNATRGSEH